MGSIIWVETLLGDDWLQLNASTDSYKARWCLHLASSVKSDGTHLGIQLAEDICPCGSCLAMPLGNGCTGPRRTDAEDMEQWQSTSYHGLSGTQLQHLTVVWMSEIQWYLHSHVPGYNAGARVDH